MITNKDIRVENGSLILNGDKYPLGGQSPETIMGIVKDNSDTTPTENSTAPITSGGVYTALGTKQDTLTFDNAPTDASANPVTSGGVYTALASLIKSSGERQFTFTDGTCTFDLTDIDAGAYELLNVFAWGSDIPLAFSLVNWNLRRYKLYHLTNTSYSGTLALSVIYRV